MSVSGPFIARPIATALLTLAVTLGGLLGYWWLPVSSLPQVDFPTIQVTTQMPGANPETMGNLVTALEGRETTLGQEISAFEAERARWGAYYQERLARARVECTITGGGR